MGQFENKDSYGELLANFYLLVKAGLLLFDEKAAKATWKKCFFYKNEMSQIRMQLLYVSISKCKIIKKQFILELSY